MKATIKRGKKMQVVSVPQNWSEVTYSQFDLLKSEGVFKTFFNINESQVSDFSQTSAYNAFKWMEEEIPILDVKFDLNIAADTWGKLEKSKQYIFSKSEDEAIFSIINLYLKQDASKWLMPKIMAFKVEFSMQFIAFFEKYAEISEYNPTNEQIQAGIEDLNVFGFLNLLDELSKGDVTKQDEVLNVSAEAIYMKLLKDLRSHKFKMRYEELINKKNAL